MSKRIVSCAVAASLLAAPMASAAGFDHRVTFDQSGIWNRHIQTGVLDALVAGEIAGALWEGGETELGKTFWQSIDASAIGSLSAEAMKYAFTRARPIQSADPNKWFQGGNHHSFPSDEVTTITSIVTPFILEYAPRHPAAYALAALPLYDGIARVKSQAHWQTDILASWALGAGIAWYAHSREHPLILGVLPHGFEVGIRRSF